MPASAPALDLRDGTPLWRLQVEDPTSAAGGRAEFGLMALPLAQGGVIAVVVKLFDGPGQPLVFHQCGSASSPALNAWVSALRAKSSLILRFERRGWLDAPEVSLKFGPDQVAMIGEKLGGMAQGLDGDRAALQYLEFYKQHFPRLRSPEAVWQAFGESLKAGKAAATRSSGLPGWIKWLLALLALAAALSAWLLFGRSA